MKRLVFVDDEPRILQGLQRQLRNMRHEWKMDFASSGAQALEFMAAGPTDVIVTDMMMPVMDGAQLLTEVTKLYPATVRIVLSGHVSRESALRLVGPAHQYLSKPCSTEQLRNAITRAFAMQNLLGNERLRQLTSCICVLPSLPSLEGQLTQELHKKEPSVERAGEIMASDIGMTTKILQLVNSAFFGLPQPINNTKEAAFCLGLATIRALVLGLQVFSPHVQRDVKGFSIEALMQHSHTVSVLARAISEMEHCDPKVVDECFVAGLLHDLGQLILAGNLPDDFARVLETARAQRLPLWQAEQAEFGATHAEVGAYLLGLWGLSDPVIEAVALHHRPADVPAEGFSPVIAVHAADAFSHDLEDTGLEPPVPHLDIDRLATLGLRERVELWRTRCLEGRS